MLGCQIALFDALPSLALSGSPVLGSGRHSCEGVARKYVPARATPGPSMSASSPKARLSHRCLTNCELGAPKFWTESFAAMSPDFRAAPRRPFDRQSEGSPQSRPANGAQGFQAGGVLHSRGSPRGFPQAASVRSGGERGSGDASARRRCTTSITCLRLRPRRIAMPRFPGRRVGCRRLGARASDARLPR